MPRVEFTSEELTAIANALNQELVSAKRAQKTGKTPQIVQVYKLHEASIGETLSKVLKYANGAQQ